jgi:UDPglucose 6-dehydrogenase
MRSEISIQKSFRILHEDKRWYGSPAAMKSYVYPGCGYGGYCLPKDTSALVRISEKNGLNLRCSQANIRPTAIKSHLVDKIDGKIGRMNQSGYWAFHLSRVQMMCGFPSPGI